MMKKRSKQKQKSVFLFCIAVGVFLTFLTCVDSDSKLQNKSQSLEHQEKQNPQSKIGLSAFSPKSEMKTDNDFALVVLGKLSVGTSKTFYVNGPLADVCVGTLKNEGNFKVTGKLLVGTLQNTGEIKYEDFQEGITCPQVFPPSVTDFIRGQKVIRFGEGWVEEYDRDGSLIRRVEGKFYVDPSGAEWVYRNDGSWGMKGDKPSELEGYSLVFETDFRNPAKRLDVYDGGIYVKGRMKDSGNLVVRDKPDEWSVVVLGDGFFTSDIDITGKVYIGGDMRLVGEDEGEFQGEYRYKIKGDLFVKGDFTSNVNFSINNMKLVQKVADVILIEEIAEGRPIEWVQTTSISDPQLGEPAIVISVYRFLSEVYPSSSPRVSKLTPKSAKSKPRDIHTLRSIYRKAEKGETNPVLDKILEEKTITVVLGDSMNYGVFLATYGVPIHLVGLNRAVKGLKAYYSDIEFRRYIFIPSPVFVGEFKVNGNNLYVPLYPSDDLKILSWEDIGEAMRKVEEIRANEMGKQMRKLDWEYYRSLVEAQTSLLSPSIATKLETKSSSPDKKFVPSKYISEWKDGGNYFGVPWVFTQCNTASKPYYPECKKDMLWCGPTAAAQLFTYWKTERDKYCIEENIRALAKKLADKMGTGCIPVGSLCIPIWPEGQGPTWPWLADEGIEEAAGDYGYTTDANWIQVSPEEDVKNSIDAGRPALWVTAIAGGVKDWHYWLIVGYEWKEKKGGPDTWYFYVFDNGDTSLHRKNVTWWSMFGLGWSAIVLEKDFTERYRYYRDADGDGYGDPNAPVDRCEASPPQGYVRGVDVECQLTYWCYLEKPWECKPSWGEFSQGEFQIQAVCKSQPDCSLYQFQIMCEHMWNCTPGYSPPVGLPLQQGGISLEKLGEFPFSVECRQIACGPNFVCETKYLATDCNDNNSSIHPGASEVCNYVDDDCDGQVDEYLRPILYRDSDGDGYGNPNITTTDYCSPVAGWVYDRTDCDDNNSSIHPGASEVCNYVDDNCNGQKDEGVWIPFYLDADKDGYGLNPLACFGFPGCWIPGCEWEAPSKQVGNLTYVTNYEDCDDSDPQRNPGLTEWCDYKDNDCDGQVDEWVRPTFWRDEDGDGYGNPSKPTNDFCPPPPQGWVSNNKDCNDSDPYTYPGAPLYCGSIDNPDTVDNDCDGNVERWYFVDADGDGYGSVFIVAGTIGCMPITENFCIPIPLLIPGAICSNTQPPGTVTIAGDCNDDPNFEYAKYIHPGQCEVCDGGVDDDCDGANESSDPDAGKCGEYCGNQIDDDCDGEVDESNCKSCAVVPETNSYLQNLIPLFLSYIMLIVLRGKGRFKIKKLKSVFVFLLFTVSILIPFVVKAEDTRGKIPKGIKHPDFYVFSSEDKMMYIALSKEVFVKSGGKVKIEKVKVPGALRAYKIEFSEGYPISFVLMYERGELRGNTFFGFLGDDGKFEKMDHKVDKEKQIISGQTSKPGIIGIFIRGSN